MLHELCGLIHTLNWHKKGEFSKAVTVIGDASPFLEPKYYVEFKLPFLCESCLGDHGTLLPADVMKQLERSRATTTTTTTLCPA